MKRSAARLALSALLSVVSFTTSGIKPSLTFIAASVSTHSFSRSGKIGRSKYGRGAYNANHASEAISTPVRWDSLMNCSRISGRRRSLISSLPPGMRPMSTDTPSSPQRWAI